MSSFFGINIGRSALMATQTAIDTTGHNVANVNTEGYSRQRVKIDQAVTVTGTGPQGSGVNLADINRVHEVFLERQISRASNQASFDTQMIQGLEEIQSILNEPSDSSIGNALTEFWNSWESLSLRPTDAGLRGQVVQSADRLAREYNTRITSLMDAEKGFNDEIKSLVTTADQLAGQLAKLNSSIMVAESNGSVANDLRDQRDQLGRQIAELIGVEPIEEGQYLNLKLADGGPYLVNGYNSYNLTADVDLSGHVNGLKLESTPLNVTTGRIGAYLELRDKVSPELRGELSEMMARVTDQVNELHSQGYDAELRPGEHLFEWTGAATDVVTYPSSGIFDVTPGAAFQAGTHYLDVVSVDQATGTPLAGNLYGNMTVGSIALTHTGGLYTGENALNVDYHVRILETNSVPGSLDNMRVQLFKGDEAVGSAVTLSGASPQTLTFNADGMTIDAQITIGAGQTFVKGERSNGLSTTGFVSMDGGVQVHVDHTAATTYTIVSGPQNGFLAGGAAKVTFEQLKGFKGSTFTANSPEGHIEINPHILADLDRIAAAMPRNPGDAAAAGDGEMARMIASLATGKLFEFTGETATTRLGSIVQGLGEQARQAEVFETADKSILAQLDAQKQSFSGVSLDEEMVMMIQFQRGFEASARFVNTSDEMLDMIINRLGRVGL